jgi:hypothetical protein
VGAAELAGLVLTSYIRERAARSAPVLTGRTQTLVVPDDAAASHTVPKVVEVASDAAMESALLEALGSDVPPPQRPGVTLLWNGVAPARLSAVLIDAPESLLRIRPVPVEAETPAPDGDVIQHFRPGRQLWLEIAEAGSSVVNRIVYATGGCRALVFLNDDASGSLQLALRQYRHTLLTSEPVAQDFGLVSVPLPAQAPWEG